MPRPEITWQDPPNGARWNSRQRWDQFIDELKKRPGEWAVADEGVNHNAVGGPFQTLRMHGCETIRRTVEDRVVLYARWPEAS